MYKILFIILIIFAPYSTVFAQQIRYATYHETASLIVDQRLSNNVTASISLQSTSTKEFQISPELEFKIRNNTDIVAVVITNEDQCVLGVQDQICVMINIKRMPGEGGIKAAQQKARQIGDLLIDEINSEFGLNTKFHSVFIHYDDRSNKALDTSGQVSGAGTVSAVYTSSMQETDFIFNKISGILLPKQIREMGGFYDVALSLSRQDNSKFTFSIIPSEQYSTMQIQVSKKYPHIAAGLSQIDTLQYFGVDEIKKSDYFSVGFFPLNSIIQLVVLPKNNSTKAYPAASVLETTIKNNEKIPADLTKSGWFFVSDSGSKIQAVYLFGESKSAKKSDLFFTLTTEAGSPTDSSKFSYELYIVIGIGIAAAAAVGFYLKGFRAKKSYN